MELRGAELAGRIGGVESVGEAETRSAPECVAPHSPSSTDWTLKARGREHRHSGIA